ncbi:hypothetical protein O1611_g274 [Lasiodiplodia mahajangana]|uniref:Uncharacterized protein n=1 Tax=Lasiodiplodia mahajangana TaxID=1108764 RepID=A0ACC2K0Q9_9PEZI|nr:hypothetical protein O1611_g274 [Lasiodiplodia mahajangana]
MAIQIDDDSRRLLQLGSLIQKSIEDYVKLKHSPVEKNESSLPAKPLFDAQRTLLAAAGLLTELVSQPQDRLLEVSSQYFEARALHIVADKRVPDILAKSGDEGVDIKTLAAAVGIESRKLSRLMRCLCSIHLFSEKEEDVFTNNRISLSLVNNEPLRAYILLFGLDIYTSSDHLPRYLHDPQKGSSYAVNVTAWQDGINTQKPRWDWLEEEVTVDTLQAGNKSSHGRSSSYPGVFGAELEKACKDLEPSSLVKRPEHSIFGLAMVGGGRVFGQAHLYDFPWGSLGPATVVDIGGGMDLKFVLQDRAPVIKQAESEVWPRENAKALEAGRIQFVPHDFFNTNPVRHADIYWLRYILHDWSDDYCVKILAAIKPSMGPRSRIMICHEYDEGLQRAAARPVPATGELGLLYEVFAPTRSCYDVHHKRYRAETSRIPGPYRSRRVEIKKDLGLPQPGWSLGDRLA